MDNLKPCPFCGGEAIVKHVLYKHSFDDSFIVVCEECGGESDTREEAIEAWNKRHSEET